MYLRNDRIGIVDLSTQQTSEQPLEEFQGFENFSATRTCAELAAAHGPDAIILGTGVLTASFVPAACAGVICAGSGASSPLKIAPIMGFSGVELKLSGFDFVVVKGTAPGPGYLWIRDGVMEFIGLDDIHSLDAWARTDKIRTDQGDAKIQVLTTGPFGDASHPCSRLINGHWGGEDKVGLAAALAIKNLAAIAFRGMGELELAEPEKHFEDSILLMRKHIAKLGENRGLSSYAKIAERADFQGLVHRHVACYGCPFPCRSYLKVAEDPKELRLVSKEPGYLHYDIPALQKAFELGLDARSATEVMMKCARGGVDVSCALASASARDAKPTLSSVERALSDASSLSGVGGENFELSFQSRDDYEDCLGLGLCPRYWSKVGYDRELARSFAVSLLGSE